MRARRCGRMRNHGAALAMLIATAAGAATARQDSADALMEAAQSA